MKVGYKNLIFMKKVIFAFVATLLVSSASFANTELTKKDENEKKAKSTQKEVVDYTKNAEKDAVCTISCSTTVNGVTYTTSAGGWFTSCREAGNQCLRKLGELSANLAP